MLTRTGLVLAFFLILTMPEGLLSGLRQLPGSDRVAALTDTKSGPTAAMLTIWRTTLDLVLS